MPQPANLLNRFRYAFLTVLIVLTLGYGYYLYRLYVPPPPAPPPPSIAVAVLADGSVRIDGALYASADQLKPKIAEIQRAHPDAGFSIAAPRGNDFNGIAKAVVMMQQAGAKTVWVINEPAKKQGVIPASP